ncbi:MAG: hypothetical protein PHY14_00345 [Candidatus Gracilibacteria bacterium]|nr:hypothetical protein [Candidatus Gracilibacteria bacterium]
MFAFPLVNLIFLIVLYNIHRRIFYITAFVEIATYIIGVYYIESSFSHAGNQFLYYLALTGFGLVVVIGAFFVAISLNHKHLYSDHHE